MKKILALALVVVMTMAMSVPAFAADLTTNPTEGLGEGVHNMYRYLTSMAGNRH